MTVMNERGAPTPVAWTRCCAPESLMGAADASAMQQAVEASPLHAKYAEAVDRESAREILAAKLEAGAAAARAEQEAKEQAAARPRPTPRPPRPRRRGPPPRRSCAARPSAPRAAAPAARVVARSRSSRRSSARPCSSRSPARRPRGRPRPVRHRPPSPLTRPTTPWLASGRAEPVRDRRRAIAAAPGRDSRCAARSPATTPPPAPSASGAPRVSAGSPRRTPSGG